MRGPLLIVALLLGVQLSAGKGFSLFGDEGQSSAADGVEHPQGDDPDLDRGDAQVHKLLSSMKGIFGSLTNQRNSWYDRYDSLAHDVTNQSAMITELLMISKVAMPIIWNTFAAGQTYKREMALKNGVMQRYEPPLPALYETVPHPLRTAHTELTDKDDFVVEVILKVVTEANVGIRLMFEPQDSHDFDWDNDDILLAIHFRWHFDYGNDREIYIGDKYNRSFRQPGMIIPQESWPNLKVGEKFIVNIHKRDKCFIIFLTLGKEMYAQGISMPIMHTYCPTPRRTSKMITDPKKLRVIVNEDRQNTGELEVYGIAWYPTN